VLPSNSGIQLPVGGQVARRDRRTCQCARRCWCRALGQEKEENVFERGRHYARREIHEKLGGSLRAYLPTVDGQVVCACVTKELNPNAPLSILVGNGPIIERSAHALASQKESVPVFIKRKKNEWEYMGDFRLQRVSRELEDRRRHGQEAD
jgi:hypothetical protein